jgi:hypothetical protein
MATNDDLVTVDKNRNQILSLLITTLTNYLGVRGTGGAFTMGAAASTVVPNALVTASSLIFLQPTNAAAGTLVGSAECPYVASKSAGVSFTVTTASGAASGTEQFSYLIVNLT